MITAAFSVGVIEVDGLRVELVNMPMLLSIGKMLRRMFKQSLGSELFCLLYSEQLRFNGQFIFRRRVISCCLIFLLQVLS